MAVVACQAPAAPASGTPASSAAVSVAPGTAQPASAWRRIADIPTPRSEVAAAAFRGLVFVIGGFGGPQVVERFGSSWSRVSSLPIAVDHAMAVGSDIDRPGVYVFGGNSSGAPTARAFKWDPEDRWVELAPMPAPRSQAAAVLLRGRVYVVGGVTTGGQLAAPTFEYDLAQNSWRTVAAIPTPRDHLAAAELAGRVCAVAGRRRSMSANLGSLECYDPAGDRWEILPGAPTPRGGVGAAVIGGRLYLVGGEQTTGTFRDVEVFDWAARTWSRGPDLPTARHGIGTVAVGSTLYVLTGGPTPGGSQTAVCEALDLR